MRRGRNDDKYLAGGLEVFTEAIITGDSASAAENQEARGQQTFVGQQTLPIEGLSRCRGALETLGFKFGEPVDDLFVSAEFPEGWTKRATDHSMHSDLVDPQGRARGGLFYKAAFYDRKASISLNRRFQVTEDYERGDYQGRTDNRIILKDAAGQISKVFATYSRNNEDPFKEYAEGDRLRAEAVEWMNTHFPEWEGVLAYWDEDFDDASAEIRH